MKTMLTIHKSARHNSYIIKPIDMCLYIARYYFEFVQPRYLSL